MPSSSMRLELVVAAAQRAAPRVARGHREGHAEPRMRALDADEGDVVVDDRVDVAVLQRPQHVAEDVVGDAVERHALDPGERLRERQVGAARDRADAAAAQVALGRDRVSGAHGDRLVEDRVGARVEEALLTLGRDRRAAPDAVALAVGERAGEVGPLPEDPAQLQAECVGHCLRGRRLVPAARAVALRPEERRRRHVRAAERERRSHAAVAKWLSMKGVRWPSSRHITGK